MQSQYTEVGQSHLMKFSSAVEHTRQLTAHDHYTAPVMSYNVRLATLSCLTLNSPTMHVSTKLYCMSPSVCAAV